jgi:hypothetical protein
MTANVLRDAQTIPALRAIVGGGLGAYLDGVCAILARPFAARGRRREHLDGALRAATGFHVWRALTSLGDAEAAELGAGLVELAARQETYRTIVVRWVSRRRPAVTLCGDYKRREEDAKCLGPCNSRTRR